MSTHTLFSTPSSSTNHVLFTAGGAANPGMAKKAIVQLPLRRPEVILSFNPTLAKPSKAQPTAMTDADSRARYLAAASNLAMCSM